MTENDPLHNWKLAGVIATSVIVLSMPLYLVRESLVGYDSGSGRETESTFVGRDQCISCHPEAYEKWLGSDHDHAMAEADPTMVRGDFDELPEQAFYMVGTIDEAVENAKTMQ